MTERERFERWAWRIKVLGFLMRNSASYVLAFKHGSPSSMARLASAGAGEEGKEMTEYWTFFNFGGAPQICAKHRTAKAAEKAACRCESNGGVKHFILKVERVKRAKA